jgi:hypothetical protein
MKSPKHQVADIREFCCSFCFLRRRILFPWVQIQIQIQRERDGFLDGILKIDGLKVGVKLIL